MDAALEALPPAAQALLGGVGTGIVGILIFLWRAYRDWKRDQREDAEAESKRETERRQRQDRGFTVLDAGRDALIAQHEREIERLEKTIEAMERRHVVELERYERANLRKREEVERLQAEVRSVSDDRDEGWDKGRAMEQIAHEHRHQLTNLMMAVHAAGKFRVEMPDFVARIYAAGQAGDGIPPDLVPPRVPLLQHVHRKQPG